MARLERISEEHRRIADVRRVLSNIAELLTVLNNCVWVKMVYVKHDIV